MATQDSPRQNPDGLLVAAADLNPEHLLDRVRANQAQRTSLSQLPAAMGTTRMAESRRQIMHSIRELRDRVRDCGLVASHRAGWKASLELLVKKCVRKLFFRHLLQQHRVHLKLMTLLNQVVDYLEEQDRCFRLCLDESDQQREHDISLIRASVETRAETVLPPRMTTIRGKDHLAPARAT
jgi:hypothetical protein